MYKTKFFSMVKNMKNNGHTDEHITLTTVFREFSTSIGGGSSQYKEE